MPGELDDDVDGAVDLVVDRGERDLDLGHGAEGLEPHQRVLGAVGVDGGERSVVAGGHGLEHVEGLAAADLADDDAVGGAHAEGVADEVADGDPALALDVGRPALQRDDVGLLELEFGGVSMVTMRSPPGGISPESALSRVVLPVPVAPETITLNLARTKPASRTSMCSSSEPRVIISWSVKRGGSAGW